MAMLSPAAENAQAPGPAGDEAPVGNPAYRARLAAQAGRGMPSRHARPSIGGLLSHASRVFRHSARHR